MLSITTRQLIEDAIAIPAFLPVTVCTGYVLAWSTNLFGFRTRSLLERFFWSVPLSISVSTIGCVLLGMFASLSLASAILASSAVVSLMLFAYEGRQLRRKGQAWRVGIQPLGGVATVLVILWVAIILVSLVDIQGDHKLFMSLTLYDHAQGSIGPRAYCVLAFPRQNRSIFSSTLHRCAITTSGWLIARP